MGSGYVLDFSNRTFSEFFEERTRRDIDAAIYRERGTSKANRLVGSGRPKAVTWSAKSSKH